MKVLLTGSTGQVGYELARSLQGVGEVVAVDRNVMDLSNLDQVREVIRSVKPQLIVNPAAYTAVDKAESEPELAFRINAEAPGVMAEEAKALGAALVHYSTDYVFDGSQPSARVEDDAVGPLNVYGASKLAGEQAIAAAGIPHLIFRTSWVYGMRGKNFLLTMLRLAKERDELKVVADQHGAPTWSRTIADTTAQVLSQAHAGGREWWVQNSGIYHLSAQGQTTWHEFTQAIVEEAGLQCKVLPITTADYPTPARRPTYSVMSSERLTTRFCHLPDWKEALHLCMR
ncbi:MULTISPECIES: dTDP-4-dehydrorhamnose reductase [unclassified Duganella]|uniref:dTDP-4-dehydrorhamnose reductase n=1 Tax=unclassified Duganella TaxID=2636909 RepID=UPI000886F40C|nr:MULTISPECIES: dTDP-4-dehydrorhamnose reductase [unclassified Duganella]SDH37358.1 dTDP-4-dehydrorhamnose reductase [Duganella sp. OV458]SDK53791.1 dTDP-4-dehydrorhamnose reductase [Duganella sp. OV510]